LFAELSEEDQAALRERAAAEAKQAREIYEKARKSPPSKTPEDRQR
jgi:TRAP-type C4-dicarboxylate transport system substrate-binding protein